MLPCLDSGETCWSGGCFHEFGGLYNNCMMDVVGHIPDHSVIEALMYGSRGDHLLVLGQDKSLNRKFEIQHHSM